MKKILNITFNLLTFIILIIYPLIILECNVYTGLNDYNWYFGNNYQIDYYIRGKTYILMIISLIMLLNVVILLIYKLKSKQEIEKKDKLLLFLFLIQILLLIISTIYSINKSISLYGFFEQYEGIFTLSSYSIIFVFYYIYGKNFIELLHSGFMQHSLFVHSILLLGLGLLQDKVVCLTMYNPDYAAIYLLMIIPVCIYITSSTNIKIIRFIRSIICILLICTLIRTGAIYPTIVLAFELVVLLLYLFIHKKCTVYERLFSKLSKLHILVIFTSIIIFVLFSYSFISSRSNELYKTTLGISEINTYNDYVEVTLDNKTLKFSCDEEFSSKELEYTKSVVNSERYGVLDGFFITSDYEKMFFTNNIDNTYKFLTPYDKVIQLSTADRMIFTRINGVNKGREYIWARTFPIIKKHLFFGVGPDAFTYAFPHNDYIQAYCVDYGYQLITKPHSFYLQIIAQTGILSFIIFIIIAIISLLSYCNACKTNYLDLAILLAVVGFLLSGLMNDSCAAVTPLFYILLGVQASKKN